MRRHGLAPRQVEDAIHRCNLGWSLARVGEHLGVDHATVLANSANAAPPPATTTIVRPHVLVSMSRDLPVAVVDQSVPTLSFLSAASGAAESHDSKKVRASSTNLS